MIAHSTPDAGVRPGNGLLPRLQAALQQGRAALNALLSDLARHTARDGRPDIEALEPWQSVGFRLAHLHAHCAAAVELLRSAGSEIAGPVAAASARSGRLETLLTAIYCGEAVETLRRELPTLGLRLESGGAAEPATVGAVQDFATDGVIARLAAAAGGTAFFEDAMQALEQRGLGQSPADGLGEEMSLLRGTFAAFAERRVRPVAEALHREDGLIPDDLIAEAAQLGCFGLSIPAAHGGVSEQPDSLGMVVVTEELSRGALIVGSLITRPEILAAALLSGGTAEQKARFLPSMAHGEQMVAISVTEPDHGSDVGGLTCAARLDDQGHWRLNGTKTFSTFAGRAELIGLLARTEFERTAEDRSLGHRGLSMFVVEKPAYRGHDFEHVHPGYGGGGGRMLGRAIATLGYRGMHSYELTLEDYPVPAANLVGGAAGRGQGFYMQMAGFAHGRLQTSGRALGVSRAAHDAARAYCAQRRVFGKTLDQQPLTREKLVRMAAHIEAGRQATYAAARSLNAGGGHTEASLVKLLTCRNAEWITREAMQLHGGMGYAEEFPVSRYFVDARVLSIFEGTEEVLALRVILPALLREQLADPVSAPPRPRTM